MKLILNTPRPRNPIVLPSRQRHAGRHQRQGMQRQQGRRELRAELNRLPMST
jgi:hypothetical protein